MSVGILYTEFDGKKKVQNLNNKFENNQKTIFSSQLSLLKKKYSIRLCKKET